MVILNMNYCVYIYYDHNRKCVFFSREYDELKAYNCLEVNE